MALYKFKIYFEDNEDIYRVIEIKSGQTFLDLHDAILASIGFDKKHDASFYMSDDLWRKGAEITTRAGTDNAKMKDAKLNKYINDPHQKIIFVYDFTADWTLYCELNGIIIKEDVTVDYPNIAKSVGKPPKQYATEKKIGEDLEEDEFEYITRNLLAGDVSKEELDEHVSGFGSEGEEEGEGEDDVFGTGPDETIALDED